MKTVEELLKTRYKVIADYPHSDYSIGDIVDGLKASTLESWFDEYPHLFKKLEWWEEREIEDMPKYLKFITGDKEIIIGNYQLFGGTIFHYKKDFGVTQLSRFEPVTESEYTTYISQTKP